jgi:hypothetical protein
VDVWERLAMLGATESERAVCAERLAAALETSIAACTADADVLACRAERAIDARRIAAQLPVDRRLAVEAVVYAELAALVDQARARFAALPELTPTTIRAFRRAAEPLLAHVFDRPLLTALGLDADRARLETSLKPTGSSTASRT